MEAIAVIDTPWERGVGRRQGSRAAGQQGSRAAGQQGTEKDEDVRVKDPLGPSFVK